MQVYTVYGLRIASDFPFSSNLLKVEGSQADLVFSHVEQALAPDPMATRAPIYTSPYYSAEDRSILYLYREPEFDHFHFPEVADITCRSDKIDYHLLDEAYTYLVEIYFLGWVLAYWLEQHGMVTLHGSAVAIEGQAAVFLGDNQAGKSTLAASLMQRGYPLLTDDLLPVEQRNGIFLGRPGYPQMRLWPDEVKLFRGHFEGIDLMHPKIDKWRVPVRTGGIGLFQESPLPIGCIYLLERTDNVTESSPIEIARLRPAEAVVKVMQRSFLDDMLPSIGSMEDRFEFLVALTRVVPVRRLHYPGGQSNLPAVIEAVLNDFSEQTDSIDTLRVQV